MAVILAYRAEGIGGPLDDHPATFSSPVTRHNHDSRAREGCPGSRRTLSGGPPASSAPVGSVRGANQVRKDGRNRREEGTRAEGRHGLGGDRESASTADSGGARRARRGSEGGSARAQRGCWARRGA